MRQDQDGGTSAVVKEGFDLPVKARELRREGRVKTNELKTSKGQREALWEAKELDLLSPLRSPETSVLEVFCAQEERLHCASPLVLLSTAPVSLFVSEFT